MKKRYLDGSHMDPNWLIKYSSNVKQIKGESSAYIALIHMDEVSFTFPVDYDDSGKCLIDSGYKCFVYMPMEDNWCLSLFMNAQYDIIEWYFDMTKENGIEEDKPYFIDLYLDIAVSPKGIVRVLDEDELMAAHGEGLISAMDVTLANRTCQKLLKKVSNKNWLYSFVDYIERLKPSFIKK